MAFYVNISILPLSLIEPVDWATHFPSAYTGKRIGDVKYCLLSIDINNPGPKYKLKKELLRPVFYEAGNVFSTFVSLQDVHCVFLLRNSVNRTVQGAFKHVGSASTGENVHEARESDFLPTFN